MIFINIFFTALSAWLILWAILLYRDTRREATYFRLIELKDRLAILVLQGKLRKNDKKYLVLDELFEESLNLLNNSSVTGLLNFIGKEGNWSRLEPEINKILSGLNDTSPELEAIIMEYFKVIYATLRRKIKILNRLLRATTSFLAFIRLFPDTLLKTLRTWERTTETAEKDLEERKNKYLMEAIG